jgi:hypothetical protein
MSMVTLRGSEPWTRLQARTSLAIMVSGLSAAPRLTLMSPSIGSPKL